MIYEVITENLSTYVCSGYEIGDKKTKLIKPLLVTLKNEEVRDEKTGQVKIEPRLGMVPISILIVDRVPDLELRNEIITSINKVTVEEFINQYRRNLEVLDANKED